MSKKRRPLSTKKADDAKKNVPPGYTLEEWLRKQEQDAVREVIQDKTKEMMQQVMDAIYAIEIRQRHKIHMIREALDCAHALVEVANLKRDNGEPESDADTWEPDLEPTTGVIDTWAPGSVPVVPVPLEDTARAANSSGGVGVSPSSGRSPAGSPRRGRRRAASINTGITAMVGGGGGGGGGGSGGPAARRRGRSSAMPFPPSELPSHTQQLQMQYLRQQLSSTSSHSLPGSAADRRQHSTDAQEVPGSRRAVTEDKADVASTTSNDNHDSDNGNDVGVDGGGAGTRRDSRQRPKSTGSTASGAGPSRGRAERSISTRSAPKAREAPTQGDSHAPRPPPPSLPPPTSASASRGRSLRSLPAAVPFEGNQRSVLPGIGEAHARTDAPLQSEAAQKQQQQQHVVSSR